MKVVRWRLDKYLDGHGITRYALSEWTDIPYPTIDNYYKNKVFRIDGINLGKIIDALGCGIEDLLEVVEVSE
jgi:DNA-binding Xre family transcriptional regulator